MRAAGALLLMTGLAACAASPALAADKLRCVIDEAPDRACTMTDRVEGGIHHMEFRIEGEALVTFVGRSQTGWWSGTLNGRSAMGYERNRGNMIFSTTDLQTTFAWWYPDQAHGTY